jgi:hypothetical protein
VQIRTRRCNGERDQRDGKDDSKNDACQFMSPYAGRRSRSVKKHIPAALFWQGRAKLKQNRRF